MNPLPIFADPTASRRLLSAQAESIRKRKRDGQVTQLAHTEKSQLSQTPTIKSIQSVEYSAVVTPEERSQRRLAGLPLDEHPPSLPFPHARAPDLQRDEYQGSHREVAQRPAARPSLHNQHIAAMTAVLHRCMMTKDYARASRALGLLLRNEVNGQPLNIRNQGLWGLGAEILLRNHGAEPIERLSGRLSPDHITREGFERAKSYYERLIVQYPKHKTWPDAVNALDFCIALFNLWVFVTNQESLRLKDRTLRSSDADSIDETSVSLLEAKVWEFEQAQQIAEAMDLRMRDTPFQGNTEMVRLRGLVALWSADLLDACEDLERREESSRMSLEQEGQADLTDRVEHMAISRNIAQRSVSRRKLAADYRSLAKELFRKF